MINIDEFFEDGELSSLLKPKLDPWIGSNFEGYLSINNKSKGIFGEHFVSKIMEKKGSQVCRRINSSHDRMIDGYKTEIKFSLSQKKNKFLFNHIACHKDWERIILLGVNPNNHVRMNWIYKEDFIKNIQSDNCVFNRQQGGKKGENDDFMFSSEYFKLENTGILNSMDVWLKDEKKKTGIELWI